MDYTLENCQKLVDDWVHTFGVRYFSELTNTAILMEEVGELARIMARQYGEQSFKENERDLDLGGEMADILFVLICLANQTGVELEDAFKKSIEKKTRRDKERHSKNPKLLKETVSSTSPSKGTDNDSP
jgi:NTP pyrophosphatase (non-canonical NTP hydrolase)